MSNELVVVKQGLTGGTSSDLDSISYILISDNSIAFVNDGVNSYIYEYDILSSAVENSPSVIAPDNVGANPGRWILKQPYGVYNENLLNNPAFIINQNVYSFGSTVAAGSYFLDHWFNDAGSGGTKTLSRVAVGTPGVDEEYYFTTTGASQAFGAMLTNPGASIPIDLIKPGDPLTISAKIAPGGSVTVYTGYGSSTGSSVALTTSLAGTLTSSDDSITFSADFGGWPSSQVPLAITLVGTTFKDVKVERGSVKTEYRAKTFREELEIAQYYYRTTYNYGVALGTTSADGGIRGRNYSRTDTSLITSEVSWLFPHMFKTPTFSFYSYFGGTLGYVSWYNGSSYVDGQLSPSSPTDYSGQVGFTGLNLNFSLPDLRDVVFQAVADARY